MIKRSSFALLAVFLIALISCSESSTSFDLFNDVDGIDFPTSLQRVWQDTDQQFLEGGISFTGSSYFLWTYFDEENCFSAAEVGRLIEINDNQYGIHVFNLFGAAQVDTVQVEMTFQSDTLIYNGLDPDIDYELVDYGVRHSELSPMCEF